ncbi:hypothetical protein DH2020_046804 [Rehmannia glutinosa]|uniref:EF-hand domain-containing protein n=1 Tax=Rehmannia glutinosa TaxID=99300 RepID=A0ABR0UAD6_REHGL
MLSWSALRRSSPFIHRFPAVQRLHFRQFSTAPPPPESSYFQNSSHDNGKTNILGWISAGIITSSTLALSMYSFYSPSPDSSYISFADWSAPASTTGVAAADALSQSSLHNQNDESKFLFGEAYRRKIFFNYEKRIRMRSPPEKLNGDVYCVIPIISWSPYIVWREEFFLTKVPGDTDITWLLVQLMVRKVFEYFASIRCDDGEVFMTPADLMRALVPVFPPSESHLVRDGYLRGERNPGELRCIYSLLRFSVYQNQAFRWHSRCLILTAMGREFSRHTIVNWIAINDAALFPSEVASAIEIYVFCFHWEIDREEFKKVMTLMRAHNRQGAVHCDGLRAGHKLGGSVENGGLLEYFFGRDGKNLLQHDKFVQFLRDLHDEMVKLEFAHYDYKLQGTIPAKDFALSMVASADLKHLNKLLDRVDDLDNQPHLLNIRITSEEFLNFAELRRKLQPFSLAVFSFGQINGLLTRKDLKRAASQVALYVTRTLIGAQLQLSIIMLFKHPDCLLTVPSVCGVSLTDNVLDIIFHVFDANQDGSLSSDEFVRVLHKRERDIAHPTEADALVFFTMYTNWTELCDILFNFV